jgi:hypothetical protein
MMVDTPKSTRSHATTNIYDAETNARHEMISVDVARRLRKACHYLSDAEFAELVDKIVKTQLSAERRAGRKPS